MTLLRGRRSDSLGDNGHCVYCENSLYDEDGKPFEEIVYNLGEVYHKMCFEKWNSDLFLMMKTGMKQHKIIERTL